MFHVGFLLCIVANWLIFLTEGQTTLATTTLATTTLATPPTALEFSCDDENGTISITSKGLDTYASIYAIGTKDVAANANTNGESKYLCDVIDASSGTAYKFQIKHCKPDSPVTVYIMKVPSQNQNNPASEANPVSSSGFIIGGDGFAAYSLQCFKTNKAVNLPDIFTVTKTNLLTLSSTITTHAPEGRVYIEMAILAADGKSLNSDPILLGTKLIVLIKGPAGPVYHVKQCRAYDTNAQTSTSTVLVSDKISQHPELMTDFAISTTDTTKLNKLCNNTFCMQSTLYAFRFKNGNSVTLECTIDVCNNFTQCAKSTSFDGKALTFHRRRRESDSQLHVLRSTIVVQDHLLVNNPETTSKGNMHRTPFHLIATLAALWVFRTLAFNT